MTTTISMPISMQLHPINGRNARHSRIRIMSRKSNVFIVKYLSMKSRREYANKMRNLVSNCHWNCNKTQNTYSNLLCTPILHSIRSNNHKEIITESISFIVVYAFWPESVIVVALNSNIPFFFVCIPQTT